MDVHLIDRTYGLFRHFFAAPKFTDGVIGLRIHTGGGVKMRWKDIYIQDKVAELRRASG